MTPAFDIEQMTLEEKLRAMEALWEDLCLQEERVPMPQWHKDILDERAEALEEGKARIEDWEIVKKRLSEKRQ